MALDLERGAKNRQLLPETRGLVQQGPARRARPKAPEEGAGAPLKTKRSGAEHNKGPAAALHVHRR